VHGDLTGLKTAPDTILGHLFHSADWVTAVSNAILSNARKLIPEITERSSTIYACTDPSTLTPAPLPFENLCILGIGRLTHEKGFDLFLDSIPAIVERFPHLLVKIIGDGPERSSLEQRASGLGVKESVEFTGSIPNSDIPGYINAATLVVVPSRYQEAFGIVAVEAAVMERPVVAANVCGLAEIVIDDETGLLVEMENSRALSNAIITLLSQPEKAKQMGQAARSRAQQEFSVLKYVDAYDRLYQRLAVDNSLQPGEQKNGQFNR
jgi:glycogen(starch) synthase